MLLTFNLQWESFCSLFHYVDGRSNSTFFVNFLSFNRFWVKWKLCIVWTNEIYILDDSICWSLFFFFFEGNWSFLNELSFVMI